ncbi:sulfite exporter TauE/SafE family protein [Chryseosolibacter indicus]|uniref:Probable membrane transporter protein n=1 Tax=Chryseosolibacter indicus TaxID=2782351 RepID=A0ABS5VPZ7_9BACT|nr:sulfite exporter TauE/SafE family protein [Chryseosolibacter indicus]MBT1703512.1 sulfite exporter TauE/SafE family protein [Chryseosolibacter indicus]
MDSIQILLIVSFFAIALIYASVGFGGGSSYLALLAVTGVQFDVIRPTALLCNIVVVTGGTYIFYKEGKLDLKKCWPFIAISIPLSFIGGIWKLEQDTFFLLLGLCLILASILLWIQPGKVENVKSGNIVFNSSIGGAIGLLSGLVGIGGGIFLSPILHLLKWDDAKRISALASLFILVNSVSGLAGQITKIQDMRWPFILPLAVAVLAGGQLGSRLGIHKFNQVHIKRVTSILILIAGINILKDHL